MPGVRLDGEGDVAERGEIDKQRDDLKRAREPERAASIRRPGEGAAPWMSIAP